MKMPILTTSSLAHTHLQLDKEPEVFSQRGRQGPGKNAVSPPPKVSKRGCQMAEPRRRRRRRKK